LRSNRFAKQIAFLKARLSPEGYLGLHLTIGALTLMSATWVFGHIAEDVVTADHLTVVDTQFSAWLHARAHPSLTAVLFVITTVHGYIGVTILTIAAVLILMWRQHRSQALALLCSVFGGMLLNVILKQVFLRARPHFENPIATLTTYGFPSGHTMMATCFYGALAAFAIWNLKKWPWAVLAVLAASFMILLVGFSRIYLGAHYLSDVAGAMAEGLVWLAFCLTAVSVVHRRLSLKS
jgi:membrane-associated phospholipid phosphatase